jgi:hypothetical protein
MYIKPVLVRNVQTSNIVDGDWNRVEKIIGECYLASPVIILPSLTYLLVPNWQAITFVSAISALFMFSSTFKIIKLGILICKHFYHWLILKKPRNV